MTSTVQYNQNSIPGLAMGALLSAGIGAAAATIFTTVGPVGGAVFGASYYFASHAVNMICDQVNWSPDDPMAQVAKCALATIAGIAAAAAITTLVGFPLTFGTAVVLSGAMFGTALAIILACGGTICCSLAMINGAFGSTQQRV